MKIDRRSFLSFLIGGAAGTTLSPLPWKLTDDISIWSQMWPWTPVPEKGEVSYASSACTLCPGGCGINVRTVDQRVVKIEGLPGHPINDGRLCTLGLSGTQLLYGPRRVKSPLKKVNGRFVKITWDDAISELATKLKELRNGGNTQRIACISNSDRGTVAELLNRFLTVYGSPQFFRMPSIQDSYELTLELMQGVRATAGFDIDKSDMVVSFGSGLLEGWGTPVHMFRAHSHLQDKGGRLVQIEPRLSNTAAKADNWIAVNPGTESVLALGMAHVIIKESLYHAGFIGENTTGFETWKKMVLDGYSPSRVAKVTGVEENTTVKLAKDFAQAKKPLAICGRGKGLVPGSVIEFMAVHALNALVGNIGKEGGVWALPEMDYINWPEPEMDDVAAAGMQQERLDMAGTNRFPHARYLLNRLPEAINSDGDSPIQLLFISDANPAYSMPNSTAFIDAIKKIPIVVSFSSFMGETESLADYVLPTPTFLERYEDRPISAGFNRPVINLTKPVVEPLFNTMHTGDVVIQLAQAVGGSVATAFPWANYQECLEETLGEKWETLIEKGYWVDSGFTPPPWSEAFETETSRFEFINAAIDSMPSMSPIKPDGGEAKFPLVLVPFDTMRLWNGYIGNPQFVIKSVEDTILKGNDVLVEINPATAKAAGLKENSYALLTTPKGKAKVRIYYYDGIMPGLVGLPRGLGHTAFEKNLAGKGANINALMASVEDPATGLDAAWGIRAKLDKA
jgi:anaerobic selenocysteine-containing dehydrogenase